MKREREVMERGRKKGKEIMDLVKVKMIEVKEKMAEIKE